MRSAPESRTLSTILSGIAATAAIAGLAIVVAAPSFAAPRDGRWAIDAACVPVGCFPGDAPGYPVEIALPGSYVLTSDLDVRAESSPEHVTAIVVSGAAVDLDLDGFALRGPVTCTGSPVTCGPSGVGVGLLAENGALALRLHDGTVTGFGAHGVQLFGDFPVLERLRLTHHRSSAIVAFGVGAQLSELVVYRSGGIGVVLEGAASSLRDSAIALHAVGGVQAQAAATIESSVVTHISINGPSVAVGHGSRVGGSLVTSGSKGIVSPGGSLVLGGWSSYSVLWQLDLGPGSGYTATWMDNSSNLFATGGYSLGQNLCTTSNC